MWGVAPLVLQPIQFGKARQLLDHNYNLAALSGPTWTNPAEERLAALLCPSRHQTLGRCQVRWVISQSVSHCVFFRSPLSVLENELLQGIKKKAKKKRRHLHLEISRRFVQSSKVRRCSSQPAVYYGAAAPFGHDSLFMRWTGSSHLLAAAPCDAFFVGKQTSGLFIHVNQQLEPVGLHI